MIKPDTLVILTPGFPVNEADSVCLPLQQSFVRTFRKNYPAVEIIILSFQFPYHTHEYNWYGIPVIPFDGRNRGGVRRLLLRKKINARLNEINHSHRIIGLLSFWYNECAFVGKNFAKKERLLHYCWILGQDAKKENKYPGKIRPESGELLALSDFLQDEFERNHGVRPAMVMPPGIDPSQFPQPPVTRDIDILAAGSLIPLKQYDLFIEIIAGIKDQLPGLKVMLVGDGPDRKPLQGLIQRLDLDSIISLSGELSHQSVLELMQRSKLFLHTSAYEGFGMVCLEALHAGSTVISFVRPMKDQLTNWYTVDTQEEMEQKALELLTGPDTPATRVTPFLISDSVKQLAVLFNL